MLSALQVIDEVMKLLNNIEVHTINIASLLHLYDDYAGILEYPVSLPLADWQLVCVVFTQLMPWLTIHL